MKKIFIAITVAVLAVIAAPAFAAMNPFMDVPASHWAYDAVAQLAARGVVSGYPDGSYKGPQPATRYEIASIIARALALIDFDKADRQDAELMRRLIVEFSDELDALGVRAATLESRFGEMDKDLGGWKLSGVLEFNANFGTDDMMFGTIGKNDFDMDKYRIFLDRRINDTTSFHARLGRGDVPGQLGGDLNMAWEYYYITTNIGYDIMLDAGSITVDFEDDLGLIGDDSSYIGDWTLNGFLLRKDWGMANIKLLAARNNDWELTWPEDDPELYKWESFVFGANLDFVINEMFQTGAYGYYQTSDLAEEFDSRLDLAIYAKFMFHPSIEFKGVYYYQNIADKEDNGSAWKVILAADQDLLKFTSLQLEYAQIDNDYWLENNPYTKYGFDPYEVIPILGSGYCRTRVMGVYAEQKWGDTKWDSWARFYHFDFSAVCPETGEPVPNANNYGLGVNYQLNPAVQFGLGFDYVDWGDFGDDHVIRFSTVVSF